MHYSSIVYNIIYSEIKYNYLKTFFVFNCHFNIYKRSLSKITASAFHQHFELFIGKGNTVYGIYIYILYTCHSCIGNNNHNYIGIGHVGRRYRFLRGYATFVKHEECITNDLQYRLYIFNNNNIVIQIINQS